MYSVVFCLIESGHANVKVVVHIALIQCDPTVEATGPIHFDHIIFL